MTRRDTCTLCGKGRYENATAIARVHSNVRHCVNHLSTVWQCPICNSLHSLEDVDLGSFYQNYPYSNRRLDFWTRKVFAQYVRRLRHLGLTSTSSILDYGCSKGIFLDYLREIGVTELAGYDAYVDRFSNTNVLKAQYDFVIAQDVIEHVEQPEEQFETLANCVKPGGILCIGTPRADGIRLDDAEYFIHTLHQPYHLHIFSEAALLNLASRHGLIAEKVYRRHIVDTASPFVNWTFLHAYLRKIDNTLDAGFEPPRLTKILMSPYVLLMGLVGYLFPIRSEILVLFRKTQ